jgi:hypothetical protein
MLLFWSRAALVARLQAVRRYERVACSYTNSTFVFFLAETFYAFYVMAWYWLFHYEKKTCPRPMKILPFETLRQRSRIRSAFCAEVVGCGPIFEFPRSGELPCIAMT